MILERFVIVLTTSKGEFYWDGASKLDYKQTMGVNRTFGWVERLNDAQMYHQAHAANQQAKSLDRDMSRLIECGIEVRSVAVEHTSNGRQAQFTEEVIRS